MPDTKPETIPVPDPTVAIEILLLLHVPPEVTSLNIVVKPVQTFVTPVIADGDELTVIIEIVRQPVLSL